jgi:hypothetical protein
LHEYFIDNAATPLIRTYTEELKRQQSTLDSTTVNEPKCGKTHASTAHAHLFADANKSIMSNHYPLIFFAEQFLAQSLKILAQARSNLIRFDGSSMYDRNWVGDDNKFD